MKINISLAELKQLCTLLKIVGVVEEIECEDEDGPVDMFR